MIKDRTLFVGGILLGFLLALPTWAFAKGQWCNDKSVLYRTPLTLESLTVAGRVVAPPTGVAYDVTSRATSDIEVSAHLFCVGCAPQTSTLEPLELQP